MDIPLIKWLALFFRMLYLREDKVTDGNYRQDVLSNAVKTIEDYFVAPPGNIRGL